MVLVEPKGPEVQPENQDRLEIKETVVQMANQDDL